MSLDIAPAGGAESSEPVSTPAIESTPSISPQSAAAALAQRRWEKTRQAQAAPEQVEQTQQELPEMASADPQYADPGEQGDAEPAEDHLSPIEPPRSWTKDEKDRFQSLPRETQQYIAQREQERERAIRQSQNEAAEIRKRAEAEFVEYARQRQQIEARLPELMSTLQAAQAGQFADIRTTQDVQRLATEDPLRYLQWTAHQQQVAAVQNEYRQIQERQVQEFRKQWDDFATREDRIAVERIPELSDPQQRGKVQQSARDLLGDLGFTESEIASAWNGQSGLSPRDHRFQMLVMDAIRYREGKANARRALEKAQTERPLPSVQRPGTTQTKSVDSNIENLSKKLEQTGRADDAFAVIAARRAAQSRRAT